VCASKLLSHQRFRWAHLSLPVLVIMYVTRSESTFEVKEMVSYCRLLLFVMQYGRTLPSTGARTNCILLCASQFNLKSNFAFSCHAQPPHNMQFGKVLHPKLHAIAHIYMISTPSICITPTLVTKRNRPDFIDRTDRHRQDGDFVSGNCVLGVCVDFCSSACF